MIVLSLYMDKALEESLSFEIQKYFALEFALVWEILTKICETIRYKIMEKSL